MLLDVKKLNETCETAFGIPLSIACAAEPLSTGQLSPDERQTFAGFTSEARATDWLKGRKALKRLLDNQDTSSLSFPNAMCSLTHSGNMAIAVATACNEIRGIGIDLEFYRAINAKTARLFLCQSELDWLDDLECHDMSSELIRLWTVKEALFKSDPENKQRWLSDYTIDDPAKECGYAGVFQTGERIKYMSTVIDSAFLTIAVYPGDTDYALR